MDIDRSPARDFTNFVLNQYSQQTMIRTFLLVDDDPDDIDLFEEALKRVDTSIEFYRAEDGSEVISLLKQDKIQPDIIFLDINMPDMNGWDCLAELKKDQKLKDIPVVMYSTSSAAIDGKKAISNGALGYLEKPPTFHELEEFLLKLVPASSSSLNDALRKIAAAKRHRLVAA
jgi:CheY-like chemotaxis protein